MWARSFIYQSLVSMTVLVGQWITFPQEIELRPEVNVKRVVFAGQSKSLSELKFCSPKVRDRRRVWLSEIVGLVGGQWSVTRKIGLCGDIWKLRYIHYCLKIGSILDLIHTTVECWMPFSKPSLWITIRGHSCSTCDAMKGGGVGKNNTKSYKIGVGGGSRKAKSIIHNTR